MFQRVLIGLIGVTLLLWAAFWIYTAVMGFKSFRQDATLHTDRSVLTYVECRKCDTSTLELNMGSDSTFTLTEVKNTADTMRYSGSWDTDSGRLLLYASSGEIFDYYLAVDGALQFMGSDTLLPVHTFPAKE